MGYTRKLAKKADSSDIYDPATRRVAVTAGFLFITATITFLIGDSLVREYFSAPAGAASVAQLSVGVALQVCCGLAVVGIGLVLLRLLGRFHQGLATGYLTLRCIECAVIVAVGAYMLGARTFVPTYESLIYVFTGIGGLMLAYVLFISKLVPEWLSGLGIVGYIVILLAVPSDLLNFVPLDSGLGTLFYLPGGLFEIVLPILLITRGFRRVETPVAPAGYLAGTG